MVVELFLLIWNFVLENINSSLVLFMVAINVGKMQNGEDYVLTGVDPFLIKLTKRIMKRLKRNSMYILVIAGKPGCGKSNLMKIIGKIFDPSFNNSHIAFGADEFIRKANIAKKFSFLGCDESFRDLNTSKGRTNDYIKIINHLQLLRKRQLFLCFVLPDFFSLQKSLGLNLCNHLIVVYESEQEKGKWLFYDRTAKDQLYIKGSLNKNYYAHDWNEKGNSSVIPDKLAEKEYDKLKDDYLLAQERIDNPKKVNPYEKRDKLIVSLRNVKKMGLKEIGALVGLTERHVGRIIAVQRNKAVELDSDESIANKNMLAELQT